MVEPLRVRRLSPDDPPNEPNGPNAMQILLGLGDVEFVESLFASAKWRLVWVLERDADARERQKKQAG